MKKYLVVFAVLLAVTSVSHAVIVTLNSDAETDVRNQASVNYAKGDRGVIYLCNHSSGTGVSGKGYVRFVLPDDVGTITAATLYFYTNQSNSANAYINVSGLNDGIAFENWSEASPGAYTGDPSGGLTWNNAPGNLTTSNYGFDSAKTSLLGSFTMAANAAKGTVNSLSNQALVDYLNADTNRLVNFLLGKSSVSSAWNGLATKEFDSYNPAPGYGKPQLVITYEPVPEPATLALLGLGALGFTRKR